MNTIEFFSPPDGDEVTNPDKKWLRDLVLNKGEDFWNAGAGQGSLKFSGPDGTVELLLTMEQSLGFYLEYIDQNSVYYVSLGNGSFEDTVTVYVGGDPLVLPSAFFVSREVAWTAVEEFCNTGQRSDALTWKDRSEVNWHYGYEEE